MQAFRFCLDPLAARRTEFGRHLAGIFSHDDCRKVLILRQARDETFSSGLDLPLKTRPFAIGTHRSHPEPVEGRERPPLCIWSPLALPPFTYSVKRDQMSPGRVRAKQETLPMPTLDWIGKKAVVNHHREVPYRLVHCDGEKSAGDPDAGNLLVQGDNLEALKALLPYYAGKVKCIYIDPPYNTGNEGWVYNDNVNSPEIRQWLGEVVGKQAEDLSRHDKWLCMMYPRLRLLREFLREDGVIFISSIDDEAVHLLRCNGCCFWKPAVLAHNSCGRISAKPHTDVEIQQAFQPTMASQVVDPCSHVEPSQEARKEMHPIFKRRQ